MNAFQYFNLNAKPKTEVDARIFFAVRSPGNKKKAGQSFRMPWWEQVLMYASLVIGVVFSSAILGGTRTTVSIDWRYVLWACGIGLVLMPTVFRKLQVGPEAPLVVRLGLFVQNGVFWQTLIEGISKSLRSG